MTTLVQKLIGGILAPLYGLVVLIKPCLKQEWVECQSTVNPFGRAPRTIDCWKDPWLQSIYGNPEDGVSGKDALVWYTPPGGAPRQVPYRSPFTQWAPWRAYCWSAWRNTADQLKYTYGEGS